jgi:hypothetical protein
MVSIAPSTDAIVPRTRSVGGCCAQDSDDNQMDAAPTATAAPAEIRKLKLLIAFLPNVGAPRVMAHILFDAASC